MFAAIPVMVQSLEATRMLMTKQGPHDHDDSGKWGLLGLLGLAGLLALRKKDDHLYNNNASR